MECQLYKQLYCDLMNKKVNEKNWYNIVHCNICKKINIPHDDQRVICKNICGKIYGRFHCFDCCNSLNKPLDKSLDKSLDESLDENFEHDQ